MSNEWKFSTNRQIETLKTLQMGGDERKSSLSEFAHNVSKDNGQYTACYTFPVGIKSNVDDLIFELKKVWNECALLGSYEGDTSKFSLFASELFSNVLIYGRLNVPSNIRTSFDPADKYFGQAIENALKKHGHKCIKVSFIVRRNHFQVTVHDGGEGFDWQKLPTHVQAVLHKPYGKGILIMRAFGAKLQWNERGNEVTLTLGGEMG